MKKGNILTLSFLAASLAYMGGVEAGNVKKVYVNISKDGAKAQAGDIPANYGNADIALRNLMPSYSLNGQHGYAYNGVQFKEGGALLDGVDDYMAIRHNPNLKPSSFTIEYKLTLKSDPNTDSQNNWRYLGNNAGWQGPFINIFEEIRQTNFSIIKNGVSYRYINGIFCGEQMEVGETAILSYSYDAATGNGYAYKNGKLTRGGTMVPGGGVPDMPAVDFLLSYPNGSNKPVGAGSFPGVIHEYRIWNVPMKSDAEYKQYHPRDTVTRNEPHLIGYWDLSH